jgi:hypothetical protein
MKLGRRRVLRLLSAATGLFGLATRDGDADGRAAKASVPQARAEASRYAVFVEQSGSAEQGTIVLGVLVVDDIAKQAKAIAVARASSKYQRRLKYRNTDTRKIAFATSLFQLFRADDGLRFYALHVHNVTPSSTPEQRLPRHVQQICKGLARTPANPARILIRMEGAAVAATALRAAFGAGTRVETAGRSGPDPELLGLADLLTGHYRRGIAKASSQPDDAKDRITEVLTQELLQGTGAHRVRFLVINA